MMNIFILANLRFAVDVAFDSTFDVRRILKRAAEGFFLLLAMGAPPRSIHLEATIGKTFSKSIMAVLHAVSEIVGNDKGRDDQNHVADTLAQAAGVCGFIPATLLSCLRHDRFISRLSRFEALETSRHAITRNADGITSID